MADDSLWQIEERLWTGEAEAYSSRLDPTCLMALPPPAGILKDRESIIASLRDAPRWTEVQMADRVLARPGESVAVLAYRATAKRQDEAAYSAVCTSAYLARNDGWLLVQHQQTPA